MCPSIKLTLVVALKINQKNTVTSNILNLSFLHITNCLLGILKWMNRFIAIKNLVDLFSFTSVLK